MTGNLLSIDSRLRRALLWNPALGRAVSSKAQTPGLERVAEMKEERLERLPVTSLLVKPAGPDCNLACEYCFYLRKSALFGEGAHRMSPETLEQTIRQALEGGGDKVAFGWQGGEPTLMGLEFFRRAFALQQQYRRPAQKVSNAVQTNGWLIDDEWCAFLREQDVLVGLSLDGPAHVHDRYRRTRDGRPTFERVEQAARRMLASGVQVNAVVVINDYSARFAREIYDFHYALGVRHMQFIACIEPHPKDPSRLAPWSVSSKAYGEFLCRLFDRWREDFRNGWPTVYVRNFEALFYAYAGLVAPDCVLAPECGQYLVVEHNGEVFSCDFHVEPQWRLGNVSEHHLVELLRGEHQRRFGRRKAELPGACRECRWLKLCRGGCPKDRFVAPQRDTRTHLCRGQQRFFEHSDKLMRKVTDRFRRLLLEDLVARRLEGRPGDPEGIEMPEEDELLID